MPHRIWKHDCCPNATSYSPSQRECIHCGTPGTPDGWGLSCNEHWARFRRAYGMPIRGPHMELAMKVLSGMRQKCPHCGGSGVVERGDMSYRFPWADAEWSYCPVCEGGGGVWSAPERELIGAYRHVIDQFPEAARPGALDCHGVLALEEDDAPEA